MQTHKEWEGVYVEESQTCLHLAARLDKLEILRLLLVNGAKVDDVMKDGYTPLHVGAKEGHVAVCESLLENKASVIMVTKKGFTPLHLASKYGRLEVANLLLKWKSSPDAVGKNGLTPLHVAAHYDNQQVALLLLKSGASPHASGKNGYTPLHISAKKNQMEIALTLLEYGADPNSRTSMDVSALHLAAQEGHTDMCSLLLSKEANVNAPAKHGLTPMHLAAQEDRISVAKILYDGGSLVDPLTRSGCTPLHTAAYHGNIKVANYLLSLGAKVNAKTKNGLTPLHQAAQRGHGHVVELLLRHGASPNELTNSGNTALGLAKKLGYVTIVDTLKTITTETTTTVSEEKKRHGPETINEGFMSDASDDEGDESAIGGVGFLTTNEMQELGDDSIVPTEASMYAVSRDSRYSTLETSMVRPSSRNSSRSGDSDNIKSVRSPRHSGFLVSFMVDARGGTMQASRHPDMRIVIPPKACSAPTRVTCRFARRRHPGAPSNSPLLFDAEGRAANVMALGPKEETFLKPVAIELPHFAKVRGNDRQLVVLRSNDGEIWKDHKVTCTDEQFRKYYKGDDLTSAEELAKRRVVRVITSDFPRFFAVVSRPLEDSSSIGEEGGVLVSSVLTDAKVYFPNGALTKKINVAMQIIPVTSDICKRSVGIRAKASSVLTIEPRRRKFHKPIKLTIPLPEGADMKDYLSTTEDSTLRLLCSISGGADPVQWEDITGSSPLNFLDNCVSFTSTVSARFWLLDCRQPSESSALAYQIYEEATRVPYMAKFLVFAKAHDPLESNLRVFCLTDDTYEKSLETQEGYVEIARSRDFEIREGSAIAVEFSGNLSAPVKSGQREFKFRSFTENRLQLLAKVRDSTQDSCGRLSFFRVTKGNPRTHGPNVNICNLNIKLPSYDQDSGTEEDTTPQVNGVSEANGNGRGLYHLIDPTSGVNANKSLQRKHREVGTQVGIQWPELAAALGLTDEEVWDVRKEHSNGVPSEQSLAMLQNWLNTREATDAKLRTALVDIGRSDLAQILYDSVFHYGNVDQSINLHNDTSGFSALADELGSPTPGISHVSSPYPFPDPNHHIYPDVSSTPVSALKAMNETLQDESYTENSVTAPGDSAANDNQESNQSSGDEDDNSSVRSRKSSTSSDSGNENEEYFLEVQCNDVTDGRKADPFVEVDDRPPQTEVNGHNNDGNSSTSSDDDVKN